MPSVSANFCDDGFSWVENVIRDGGELRYLCSARWHGTCTCLGREHSFYCSRHFNGRVFAVPLVHHVRALRRFRGQRERTDRCGELRAYARAMCASYSVGEIVSFLAEFPDGVVASAVRDEFRSRAKPADFELTSRELVALSRADVLPRGWLPTRESDLADHAEASLSVFLASVYLSWLGGRGRVHPCDFPGVARAISAVLARLPAELAGLVTCHLYNSVRIGPPNAV
jgi:hypothetical protein